VVAAVIGGPADLAFARFTKYLMVRWRLTLFGGCLLNGLVWDVAGDKIRVAGESCWMRCGMSKSLLENDEETTGHEQSKGTKQKKNHENSQSDKSGAAVLVARGPWQEIDSWWRRDAEPLYQMNF